MQKKRDLFIKAAFLFCLAFILILKSSHALEIDIGSLLDGKEISLNLDEEISFPLEGNNYSLFLNSLDENGIELSFLKNNISDKIINIEQGGSANISIDREHKLEIFFRDVGAVEINLRLKLYHLPLDYSQNKSFEENQFFEEEKSEEKSFYEIVKENPDYLFFGILLIILLLSALLFWKLKKSTQKEEFQEKIAYLPSYNR